MKNADWLDVAALTGLDRGLVSSDLRMRTSESAFAAPDCTLNRINNDSLRIRVSEQDREPTLSRAAETHEIRYRWRRSLLPFASSHPNRDRTLAVAKAMEQSAAP